MPRIKRRSKMEMAADVLDNALKPMGQTALELKCGLNHYVALEIYVKLQKAELLQIEERAVKTSIHHPGIRRALTSKVKTYRRIFIKTTPKGRRFLQNFRQLQAILE